MPINFPRKYGVSTPAGIFFVQSKIYMRLNMTRILLTIVTMFAILSSLACVQKGANTATNAGGGGDTIKVGVYGDLTGQTSRFGQSTKNGIELALEEINAAGGVNGKKMQMLFEDDQGRPEQAKTVVQKLISQDKVQAIL